MKIYVAGSWQHVLRVRLMMDMLKGYGHEIILDWTRHPKASQFDATAATMATQSVMDCDFVLAIMSPDHPQRGTYIEIGMGLAFGKQVWVLGPFDNVFHLLPNCRVFATEEELRKAIEHDCECWCSCTDTAIGEVCVSPAGEVKPNVCADCGGGWHTGVADPKPGSRQDLADQGLIP